MKEIINSWLQRNGLGRGFIFMISILLITIIALIGNLAYNGFQNNYTLNEEEVTIHLPNSVVIVPDVTAYNAAVDLEVQGIMDADTFQFKVEKATGRNIHSIEIKSGYYTIPPKTHYEDLVRILGIRLKD